MAVLPQWIINVFGKEHIRKFRRHIVFFTKMWKQVRIFIKHKKYWTIALIILLIIIVWKSDWSSIKQCIDDLDLDGCNFAGKSAWDWLNLLFLFFLGFWINQNVKNRDDRQQKKEKKQERIRLQQEREIARNHDQEEILKDYINTMTSLLLDQAWPKVQEGLGRETNTDNSTILVKETQKRIVAVARALTLTVLQELNGDRDPVLQKLDGERKGHLIRFLIEVDAIKSISLESADLSYANLQHADLSHANLKRANLSHANLSYATFYKADLGLASLGRANLSHANLSFAIFHGAILHYANCHHASLHYSDLSYADLSHADLSKAALYHCVLRHTILSEVNLSNSYASCALFIGTNFYQTDLNQVILSEAILLAVDLRTTQNLLLNQLTEPNQAYICNVMLPLHMTQIASDREYEKLEQILPILIDKYNFSAELARQIVNSAKQKR